MNRWLVVPLSLLMGLAGACKGGPDSGDGDECASLCGSSATPEEGAGLSSFAPPGCDGGSFEYAWSALLVEDAGKSIPVAVDMDGDGIPEIVANPRLSAGVHVFPGVGDGTFGTPVLLPGISYAGGIGPDVGDLDGDGNLDVLIGDHVAGAQAWRGQGGLQFVHESEGLPASAFQGSAFGDLDGDGDLDSIFGTDQFSTGFAVRHWDDGWTDPGVSGIPGIDAGGGTNNAWIDTEDLDGDGDMDVVAFGQEPTGLMMGQVFLNEGDGVSFTHHGDLGGPNQGWTGIPIQGGVGNLDCDGGPDIAVGGTVWLGVDSGWSAGPVVDDAMVSTLGDLDGDGFLDMVTHVREHGVRAYLNDGTGGAFTEVDLGLPDPSWVPPSLEGIEDVDNLASIYGLELADLDGDGALDLVRTFKAGVDDWMITYDYAFVEVWTRTGQ